MSREQFIAEFDVDPEWLLGEDWEEIIKDWGIYEFGRGTIKLP